MLFVCLFLAGSRSGLCPDMLWGRMKGVWEEVANAAGSWKIPDRQEKTLPLQGLKAAEGSARLPVSQEAPP